MFKDFDWTAFLVICGIVLWFSGGQLMTLVAALFASDGFEVKEFYGTPDEVARVRAANRYVFEAWAEFAGFCAAHYPDADPDDYSDDWQEAVMRCPVGKHCVFVVSTDGEVKA